MLTRIQSVTVDYRSFVTTQLRGTIGSDIGILTALTDLLVALHHRLIHSLLIQCTDRSISYSELTSSIPTDICKLTALTNL
jgi:hypothetical protein